MTRPWLLAAAALAFLAATAFIITPRQPAPAPRARPLPVITETGGLHAPRYGSQTAETEQPR